MNRLPRDSRPARLPALAFALALLAAGCGDKPGPEEISAETVSAPAQDAHAHVAAAAGGPDTSDMGPIVLAKINASPSVNGTATLVEFRQKSVSTQALGDKMRTAVVEFEGVVTFTTDVSWSWQGPTKSGAPQKFEARAEYVDQGQGWQRIAPLGIYPL